MITTLQSYSATEWTTSTQAFLDLVRQNGPTAFSFAFRPPVAPHLNYSFDAILTLENGILIVNLGQKRSMNWEDFRTSILNLGMPRNTNFLQAFEQAQARFSAEWAALEEREPPLDQEYQSAQAQMQDEQCRFHQYASAQFQELHHQMALAYQEAKNTKIKLADIRAKSAPANTEVTGMQTKMAQSREQLRIAHENVTRSHAQLAEEQGQLTQALAQTPSVHDELLQGTAATRRITGGRFAVLGGKGRNVGATRASQGKT